MKFGYTIVYVADVAASLAFFERAFGLATRFVHESGYGELETGATALAFASHELAGATCRRATLRRMPRRSRSASKSRWSPMRWRRLMTARSRRVPSR